MWNCTTSEPVTATPSSCQRSPIASRQHWSRNSMKNGNATLGFHGWRYWIPRVNDEYANPIAASTSSASSAPPRR